MKMPSTVFIGLAFLVAGAAAAVQTAPSTRPATAPATAAAGTKPAATRTARDGIYSNDQLARGKTAYNASCARCHGDTLLGNDDASALVGDAFLGKWSSQSVGKLVEYTRKEMPSDGPGKLSRRECTDIITYLLNSNGFPAGKTELSSDLDTLNVILIQPTK